MKGTANSFFGGRSSGRTWLQRKSWKFGPLRELRPSPYIVGHSREYLTNLSRTEVLQPWTTRKALTGKSRVIIARDGFLYYLYRLNMGRGRSPKLDVTIRAGDFNHRHRDPAVGHACQYVRCEKTRKPELTPKMHGA